ncbi:MAG: DUF3006 family protein [Myxococcota bacterium]
MIVTFLVVVDRVEDAVVVLELPDRSTVDVALHHLPRGLHEGDRLLVRARTLPPGRRARRGAVPAHGESAGAKAPLGE